MLEGVFPFAAFQRPPITIKQQYIYIHIYIYNCLFVLLLGGVLFQVVQWHPLSLDCFGDFPNVDTRLAKGTGIIESVFLIMVHTHCLRGPE